MSVKLKGITWDHNRGFTSVVATAQRYHEPHPEVEICWQKRSLQEFADAPIHQLAKEYDLLVIDHPWAGYAAETGVLAPLQDLLPADFLDDQAKHSVGNSHQSYNFHGFQAALAIDAAAPIATYRPDLMEKAAASIPETWSQLIELAKTGKVIFPGLAIDSLMNFYMLAVTMGEDPCSTDEYVVRDEVGLRVLEMLYELTSYTPKEAEFWNPIKVYELMTTTDDFFYCPFAYGYSNYSRDGYAKNLLLSTKLVNLENYGPLRSTLGGAGIAIAAKCQNMDVAVDYLLYTASPEVQKGIYFEAGGQPGYRKAWLDDEVNRRCNNFFKNTIADLDNSYIRPRYKGYLHFQDNAGNYIVDYLRRGGNPAKVLEKLNLLYRESRGNRK